MHVILLSGMDAVVIEGDGSLCIVPVIAAIVGAIISISSTAGSLIVVVPSISIS